MYKINYFFVSALLISPVFTFSAWSSSPSPLEFAAKLTPVNEQSANTAGSLGNAQITIKGDFVDYNISADGLDPNYAYQMSIHEGDKCPSNGAILFDLGLVSSESSGELKLDYSSSLNEMPGSTENISQLFENRVFIISRLNPTPSEEIMPVLCGRLESFSTLASSTPTIPPPSASTSVNSNAGQQPQQALAPETSAKNSTAGSSSQPTQGTWYSVLLGVLFQWFKSVLITVINSWT